ncbi:DNA-binding transcriptional regulator of glucitol operon [Actinoalloteichus hoggarensis]|uniref:Uncharacterized protein n=1 Tax=Actinoalloteichus hoggarensis TaxID=1470176 RepID=A0A221W657_9PSEU|nr:hypothetical protein [Actinoalloteichus hoggarensis]ASO21365.1 hypothetical protein AHOG_18700 [Actinoalloteichus hoggarensis]MBB5921298.1 DNA-binding transcriptional regulator of glucitol operon [Actinoalloteichus hoggarensis]
MRSELLRPRWILLHVVTVVIMLVSLRLGWWQWERSQSVGGDGQNLGYAALWPAMAAFVGYVWWRWTRLELEQAAERDRSAAAEPENATASVDSTMSGASQADDDAALPGGPSASTPARAVGAAGASPSAAAPAPESARAAAARRQLDRLRARGAMERDGTPADELSQYNGYLAELSDSDAERARQA